MSGPGAIIATVVARVNASSRYAPLSRPDLRGLAQRPLYREPLLLATPVSAAGPVHLADHADADWIAALDSTDFQAVTEMACRSVGFEPRIGFRVNSYQMVLALVAAGFGVAIVPQLAAVARRGLSYASIARPSGLVRQIYATSRAGDRSPAVEQLSRYLAEALTRAQASARS
jgi:DNA-binding transcriptional LysR family regulator